MFLESFRHLIEIEALKKQNQQNFDRITSENKRISDLEERRKKSQSQNEDLKIEEKNLKLLESQNQIEDLQGRLNKLTAQLAMATTLPQETAFKNQIQTIETEIEKLEELYFEKLEKSEEILTAIKENNDFFHGSLSTLAEIKSEVEKAVASEEVIIANRTKRIDALVGQCRPDFIKIYLDLEIKFKPKNCVSYLVDKKCTACHMMTDSTLRSSLEEGRSLECCPNCSRLLIPETAKIY
jgi:predicted  nucleic acid-binding Zn-ribbon protein